MKKGIREEVEREVVVRGDNNKNDATSSRQATHGKVWIDWIPGLGDPPERAGNEAEWVEWQVARMEMWEMQRK